MLTNTCSFDALLQILTVCYVESIEYRKWVLQKVNNDPMWELVHILVRDGVTTQSYSKRTMFFIKHFVPEKLSTYTKCIVAKC